MSNADMLPSLSSSTSDSMTVNDMLSHVISFAELNIKLTVKTNNRVGGVDQMHQQKSSSSSLTHLSMLRDEDLSVSVRQNQHQQQENHNSNKLLLQQQLQQRQLKLQINNTQQNLLHNYLMSYQKQG